MSAGQRETRARLEVGQERLYDRNGGIGSAGKPQDQTGGYLFMDATLTIDGFQSMLASEKEQAPLIEALRKLIELAKPEDIKIAEAVPQAAWAWRG